MSSKLLPDKHLYFPAQLFIDLWLIAGAWSPHQRAIAIQPHDDFRHYAETLLEENSPQNMMDGLSELVVAAKGETRENRGKILTIMKLIDGFFYRIHPRALLMSTAVSRRPHLPDWLRELRDTRSVLGYYEKKDGYYLIPRGPLLRVPRDENASNAECFADRFAALAVAACKLTHESRIINISHRIIGSSVATGIPPSSSPGAEKVAFIPIAEHENDLVKTESEMANQKFVDFRINPSLDASGLLIEALHKMGEVDIAIAPEFVMSEEQANKIPDSLMRFKRPPSRVIVAGSGGTSAKDTNLPWNESRIFNGFGAELWRQRKVWPAGLNQQRAIEYNLADPGEKGLVLEKNAAGNEIVVVDIDNLGRCVVLICQDIELVPLSEEIIRCYQPDWVFIPVLDRGINVGNWVHQRAFDLSSKSQARFLVSSSTTLAYWIRPLGKPACGLAVGPKQSSLQDRGRIYKIVSVKSKSTPGYAIITWRSKNGWRKTTIK